MNGLSIAGRKRYTTPDFYETPSWATESLLRYEPFTGAILEPACGLGAISRVCEQHGFEVMSYDIEPLGYGGQQDFFSLTGHYPNIITNPPFNRAQEFIEQAKRVTDRKIAMILKLAFLESERRHSLFLDTVFPLAKVYVFCSRVQMYPHGIDPPQNQGTIAYAWFVWNRQYQGKPEIAWISSRSVARQLTLEAA